MKKRLPLFLILLLVLGGTMLAGLKTLPTFVRKSITSDNIITMTTSKNVGDELYLRIIASGDYEVEGVDYAHPIDVPYSEGKRYRITSPNINVKGRVLRLECNNDQLTALDVTKCYSLEVLDCSGNFLSVLDLSKSSSLQQVSCGNNRLQNLDVQKCVFLESLYCGGNRLTALDVTRNSSLVGLDISNNRIKGTAMTTLMKSLPNATSRLIKPQIWVNNPKHEANIVSQSQVAIAKAKDWVVSDTHLAPYEGTPDGVAIGSGRITMTTQKKVGEKIVLQINASGEFDIEGVEHSRPFAKNQIEFTLTSQQVTIKGDVIQLTCSGNKLTQLDISQCPTLSAITCDRNELTALNLDHNTELSSVSCSNNQLSELNVTHNEELQALTCNNNNLSQLDLSHNPALLTLICSSNQLSQLDFSHNPYFTTLWAASNKLTALDFSHNPKVASLVLLNNQIKGTSMDALIASLPATKGTLLGISKTEEGNVITRRQVAALKAKNWTTYAGFFEEYEGSLEVGDGRITLTTDMNIGEMITLEVNAKGDFLIEGVDMSQGIKPNQIGFRLTDKRLTIKGDVTSLRCSADKLTALDVTQCPTLVELNCGSNRLTHIDLAHNAQLSRLECNDNQLTALDLAHNPELNALICYRNQLTALNLSANEKLTFLASQYNQLTTVDVSKCPELKTLWLHNNQISTLGLSHNAELSTLWVHNNQLSEMDLAQCPKLATLWAYNNQLNQLNLTANKQLANLNVQDNRLLSLQLPSKAPLDYVACYHNRLADEELDAVVSALPASSSQSSIRIIDPTHDGNIVSKAQVAKAQQQGWAVLDHEGNPYVGSEDVDLGTVTMTTTKPVGEMLRLALTASGELRVKGAEQVGSETDEYGRQFALYRLTAQQIKIKANLTELLCADNQISELEVTACPTLETVVCSNNQLKKLDLSNLSVLSTLDCSGNQLSQLDVNHNPRLRVFYCANNLLSQLDLSASTAMLYLDVTSNQLSALPLQSCTKLMGLWCTDNQLTQLDLSANTSLIRLNTAHNFISSEAMDALIGSLPTHQGLWVVADPAQDGNAINAAQAATATAKGWQVLYTDNVVAGLRLPISSVSKDTPAAALGRMGHSTENYDLAGRRVANSYKGIVISRKGKQVFSSHR